MLPRIALIFFAVLALLTANTIYAAPSSGKSDIDAVDYAQDPDVTKRDVQGTCPKPSEALKAFWDDVTYTKEDYGCLRGYCWSRCAGGARIFGAKARDAIYEWCWTTKGRSQDRGYVGCSKKEDCCQTWSCAGACAAF